MSTNKVHKLLRPVESGTKIYPAVIAYSVASSVPGLPLGWAFYARVSDPDLEDQTEPVSTTAKAHPLPMGSGYTGLVAKDEDGNYTWLGPYPMLANGVLEGTGIGPNVVTIKLSMEDGEEQDVIIDNVLDFREDEMVYGVGNVVIGINHNGDLGIISGGC